MSKLYKFIGENDSKGYKNDKIYPIDVTRNDDPNDFFIHINPHLGLFPIRSWNLDDTFYDSDDTFNNNWELVQS